MADDPSSPQIVKSLKQGWSFIVWFIGAITVITSLIELWRGNTEVVTWVFIVLGYLVLISTTGYIAFARRKTQFDLSGFYPRYPKYYKIARIFLLLLVIIIPLLIITTKVVNSTMQSQSYRTQTNKPCPNRQDNRSGNTVPTEINVNIGEVAYFQGWQFDEKDGGFFITFMGPYKGLHTFSDGIYCPPVPADSDLAQLTRELLIKECEERGGKCSQEKTCQQTIFTYLFEGGACDD